MKVKDVNTGLILMILLFCTLVFGQQHDRTNHWKELNQKFIAEASGIPPSMIIFFGNSITEGFDLHRFFPESKPVNRGIGGDHTDGLLERLPTSVLQLKPSKLFILIGINDIGAGDSGEVILKNYSALLQAVHKSLPDSSVYIQSILPTTTAWPNCPKNKIIKLNEEIRQLAKNQGFHWIDLYTSFVTPEGYLQPELTCDGLHLNENGYKLWAEILTPFGLK
jgi:lysophospholipase L1-like esterase